MAGPDRGRLPHTEAVPRHRCGRELQRVPGRFAVLSAFRTLSCSLAIIAGCGVTRMAHAEDSRILRGELATADTVITVEAGEHAPRLTTLKSGGAASWTN